MAEIVLTVVIVALLLERAYFGIHTNQLQRRMLNQIAAKDTHELVFLNKMDDTPAKPPRGSEEREVIHPIGA